MQSVAFDSPLDALTAQCVAFPLFPIVNGKCACGHEGCTRVGKHPQVAWGELAHGDPVPRPVDGAGYGIKTGAAPKGSGLIVVDCDSDEALSAWETLNGGTCPLTYTVRTPRGWHFYFEHPGFPVGNSAGSLGKGIDIRGDGGFVVGPGSPHRSGGTYEAPIFADLAPVPAALMTWLKARPAPAPVQTYPGDVQGDERIRRQRIYTEYLKTTPPCVQGAAGDQRLFQVVQYGAWDLSLPTDDVLELVTEHFDPRCDPPWGDELAERVGHKAHSAKTSSTRPRAEPAPEGFFGAVPANSPERGAPSITAAKPLGLGFEYGAWEAEPPPVDFLIESLVPRGCVGMVFGRADALKTWLLFSMMIALASGQSWLEHFPVKEAVRVGIVDFETGKGNVSRRLYMLRAGKNPNLGAKSFSKLKPNDADFWIALEAERFDVVLIDSLRKANPGANENDSGEAIKPLELAAEFSERTGCAVFFIHHATKSSADGWPEFRGSGAIEDQVDVSFAVRKTDVTPDRKTIEVRCVKPGDMRMPEPFAVEAVFDDLKRLATLRHVMPDVERTKTPEADEEEVRAKILLELETRGTIPTRRKVREAVGAGTAKVDAELDVLIKTGLVVKIEGKGFELDGDELRRARVVEAAAKTSYGSPAQLAKASYTTTRYVEGLIRQGAICRSGEGRILPVEH